MALRRKKSGFGTQRWVIMLTIDGAAMPNRKRRFNAYKHGVFAATPIIPGEDPREFETLYSDLIKEWVPAGATETEAVFSLASAIWRKRRAQLFLEVRLMKNSLDVNHPSFDESLGLLRLAAAMIKEPETAFQKYATRRLRPDMINYLMQKFPVSEFETYSEWTQAIINEIKAVLLPQATAKRAELTDELREPPDELRETDAARLVYKAQELARKIALFGGPAVSDDLFERELALVERLDAMIDRAVKRLVQIKAIKQMLGQASVEPAGDEKRKIAVRTSSNR